MLQAEGSTIGRMDFDEAIVAQIGKLAPGDTIVVEFGTWLKNVSLIADDILPLPDELSFLSSGKAVPRDRRLITVLQNRAIEKLHKDAIGEVGENNFAVLARHTVVFVERKKEKPRGQT